MPEYIETPGGGAALEEEQKIETPRRYKVLLHNDDYTTMEFVVEVLMEVYHKPAEQAVDIMLDVHRNGTGIAGVYAKAIAEAKVDTTHRMAREQGFPLRCSLERE